MQTFEFGNFSLGRMKLHIIVGHGPNVPKRRSLSQPLKENSASLALAQKKLILTRSVAEIQLITACRP
jgi:hypothetical protein